ncbi:putative membrane protein (plasmid) [Bacillus cereus E33L]|nr:putative membrane protein [Bacillus cereus E33L]
MKNRRTILESILYASVLYIALMGSPGATILADIPGEKLKN